ncbi:MAG: 4Fe-4S dicluster domain-containing protein, partial [Anaerolineae bacterium]|nr:4Fe-4S dicluster domain-containing protein [Anaerolineae bacterium]
MADSSETLHPFTKEVLNTQGGSLVLQCYQCGTCSGSCPVIAEMEYGPRRVVNMIQAGMEQEVLSSNDMWRCVSCYSCANRCPRGIEITDLMADLRRLALSKGYIKDREAQFGQAFAETVQVHGRLYEPELLARYYARVLDIPNLLGMVPVGIKMILKGKLPFLPDNINEKSSLDKVNVADSTTLKIGTGIGKSKNVTLKSMVLIWLMTGVSLMAGIVKAATHWGKDKV